MSRSRAPQRGRALEPVGKRWGGAAPSGPLHLWIANAGPDLWWRPPRVCASRCPMSRTFVLGLPTLSRSRRPRRQRATSTTSAPMATRRISSNSAPRAQAALAVIPDFREVEGIRLGSHVSRGHDGSTFGFSAVSTTPFVYRHQRRSANQPMPTMTTPPRIIIGTELVTALAAFESIPPKDAPIEPIRPPIEAPTPDREEPRECPRSPRPEPMREVSAATQDSSEHNDSGWRLRMQRRATIPRW